MAGENLLAYSLHKDSRNLLLVLWHYRSVGCKHRDPAITGRQGCSRVIERTRS